MKKIVNIFLTLLVTIVLLYFLMPFYLRQSLTHWYPNLDDYKIFKNDTVVTVQPLVWEKAEDCNSQHPSAEGLSYLEKHETTAFLVIQNEKIIYEKYWRDCDDATLSNVFSVTKSIVALLVGIAMDEGRIPSLDAQIKNYIPEFSKDDRGEITIRNLLNMSSGLDWEEAYTSPFSVTTQAYYGDAIRPIVTRQQLIDVPGKTFKYLSSDTQLLAYVVEKAVGKTVSKYASEKLWKPLGAEHAALWSKDAQDGDERAFCCFHTTARDIARIAQLVNNKGVWRGQRIVSEDFITEATTPASHLQYKGRAVDFYGFQWWILPLDGEQIPYLRGHKGQYIYSLEKENAVIVRMGEKVDAEKIDPITSDIIRYVQIGKTLLK